jgi:hypothetical protein
VALCEIAKRAQIARTRLRRNPEAPGILGARNRQPKGCQRHRGSSGEETGEALGLEEMAQRGNNCSAHYEPKQSFFPLLSRLPYTRFRPTVTTGLPTGSNRLNLLRRENRGPTRPPT